MGKVDGKVARGQETTVTCNTEKFLEDMDIKFYSGDDELKTDDKYTVDPGTATEGKTKSGILTISDVRQSAVFKCSATSTFQPDSGPQYIDITLTMFGECLLN